MRVKLLTIVCFFCLLIMSCVKDENIDAKTKLKHKTWSHIDLFEDGGGKETKLYFYESEVNITITFYGDEGEVVTNLKEKCLYKISNNKITIDNPQYICYSFTLSTSYSSIEDDCTSNVYKIN